MSILQAENLTKIYGKGNNQVTALDDLNLRIEKGEFVSIIGASGSGKSTLLHMFGGVDQPTSGDVYIHEVKLNGMDETQRAIFRRREIGLIYQFFNLIPTLNVKKNLVLPMLLDHKNPNQKDFDSITELLGIKERLTHMPSELSGGQQQRVAIGRALMYRPAIILADEPTGNLDKENSHRIIELLKRANEDYHQTIIMITHDESVANQAKRKITIEDGRIIADEVIAS